MTIARQTITSHRKFANGHWTPGLTGVPPTLGDEYGTEINEVAMNPNSFLALPVLVKPGQALSWFSMSADLNGDFGPFNCALSHSDQMIADAVVYGVLGSSNEPTLRFKDAKTGADDASNPRVPTDIDTTKPLFLLVWAVNPTKSHKLAIAFTNGNSPR